MIDRWKPRLVDSHGRPPGPSLDCRGVAILAIRDAGILPPKVRDLLLYLAWTVDNNGAPVAALEVLTEGCKQGAPTILLNLTTLLERGFLAAFVVEPRNEERMPFIRWTFGPTFDGARPTYEY